MPDRPGHGAQTGVDAALWLSDDPELGLVRADLHAWAEAHPCECEGLCVCEEDDGD
jgi:hypothetical protein